MRKFMFAIVLLLGVVFLLWRFSEVQAIVETLKHGDWRFMLLALVTTAAYLSSVTFGYKYTYRALGLEESFRHLFPVSSASIFLNIVAPSVGMSGMAVFVGEAHRRGYSPGRAAIAGAIYILFDYASFLCVLAVGLFVLFRRGDLNTGELVATAVLVLIASVIAVLIYLGMRSAVQLGKALAWMARLVNRLVKPFIHREYLSEQRAHVFAHEAAGGLHVLNQDRMKLLPAIGVALIKQALLITILWMSFLAFQVKVSPGTLIAGFSLGYLSLIVSPTPAGLGIVEGVMTLALASMFIPLGAATIVTLAYRAFTFWIPLIVGMIAFRSLGGTRGIKAGEATNSGKNEVETF